MISLQQKFYKILTDSCLVTAKTRLVVAVSGGPDSMALLHLLAAAGKQLKPALCVVWVDHGLRPGETPQEEQLVRGAARRLGLPCIARRVDTARHAEEHHRSLEHAARELRYRVLREECQTFSADYIAVAHTADDQVEEILLRVLRGSGRKGVAGMRMHSRDVIRPLLPIDKADLLKWLARQNIPYALDSSNTDPRFLRNRVRHQLLPFLEEHFAAGVRKALQKTASSLTADETLLEELTEKAMAEVVYTSEETGSLRITRTSFIALPEALQRRVAEQLLWQLSSRAAYDHILLIIHAATHGRVHSELHLSHGLRLGIFRDYLEFSYPEGQGAWRGRLFAR